MQRKIMVVFGTRPEAIKLAPVIHALQRSAALVPCICITGQHRQMLDQMMDFFDLQGDYDLSVMQANQSLFDITTRVLEGLQPILLKEHPDAILVQGDTTTTFAAALAGHYLRIPIGHVEAGLRSNEAYNPFPEEMNRRLTSQLATWHFAPTEWAVDNLRREGIPNDRIVRTGNTIADAIRETETRLERQPRSANVVPAELLAERRLLLVTVHRRETFGGGLQEICRALRVIAERNEDVVIVYPVHLNPQVQAPVRSLLGNHPRILLTDPLDYLVFLDLLRQSYLVLTDSGGVQEEAVSFGVPLLVLRDLTDRPEGIEVGAARLIGARGDQILAPIQHLLDDRQARDAMVTTTSFYGNGRAAEAIVGFIERVL